MAFERSHTISLYRNPVTDLGQSAVYVAGLSAVGAITHGSEITINDGESLMGTRLNTLPLFVSLGSKTASTMGRDTANWFYSGSVDDAVRKTGGLPTSVKIDVKVTGLDPTWGTNTTTNCVRDATKPHILYVEKYYDFDYNDPYYRSAPNYRVIAPTASTNYSIVINGTTYTANSGGSPTASSVNAAVASVINADTGCAVSADDAVNAGYLTLLRKVSTTPFAHSSPNMTAGGNGFNWKKYRTWTNYGAGNLPNTYFGGDGFMYTEYQSAHAGGYYFTDQPTPFVWRAEEYNVVNSSAVDVADADVRCYVNNVFLNVGKNLTLTKTATMTGGSGVPSSVGVHQPRLDQIGYTAPISTIPSPNIYMHIGYLVEDDEFNGIYVGNAATRTACTRLVRLPQTAWAAAQSKFIYINSSVPPESAYFYVRTGLDSWRSDSGVRP